MKLPHRRQFLHQAAGTVTLPVISRVASAQAYPTRPITMIVPITAGSASDVGGRLVAERSQSSSKTCRGPTAALASVVSL
jgi:tripartite-type tricarboxylate transporter receptor subunit TctC